MAAALNPWNLGEKPWRYHLRRVPPGSGNPCRPARDRVDAPATLGTGGRDRGRAGARTSQRDANRPGEPGRRAALSRSRDTSPRRRGGHHPLSLPGHRGAWLGRYRAADHRRGLGGVPPARPRPAPGLFRADCLARRAECRGPRRRRGPPPARGRSTAGALVDHRSAVERGPVSRPGRRVLAALARSSRSGDPGRRPAPGPRPRDLLVQPRYGLVRPDPLARAGRPVLRSPLPSRDAQPG